MLEEIHPIAALRLFEQIPQTDVRYLGMSREQHPKNLILTHILVPPVCIRPSINVSDGMNNEDDLTTKLMEVLKLNDMLRKSIQENVPYNRIY